MRSVLLDDSDSRNLIYMPGDIVCLFTKDGFHNPKKQIGKIVSVTKSMVLLDMSEKYTSNLVHVQMSEIISVGKLEETK